MYIKSPNLVIPMGLKHALIEHLVNATGKLQYEDDLYLAPFLSDHAVRMSGS
jgi:hypothetical protein